MTERKTSNTTVRIPLPTQKDPQACMRTQVSILGAASPRTGTYVFAAGMRPPQRLTRPLGSRLATPGPATHAQEPRILPILRELGTNSQGIDRCLLADRHECDRLPRARPISPVVRCFLSIFAGIWKNDPIPHFCFKIAVLM